QIQSDAPADPFRPSPETAGATSASTPSGIDEKRKIGKYPVVRKIGQGGMGEVWEAFHPHLNIPVAIKVLPKFLADRNPGFVGRFLKEARTSVQIAHSNIVRVYDADSSGQLHFIVMEFVDGETVKSIIKREDQVAAAKALNIVKAVAEALKEAQEHQIIHRDIKPDNIMVDRKGHIKLCDLGLAKQIDEEDLTMTGASFGTPAYVAPEQAKNAKGVDIRADIYSLGVTFYHMVTGAKPFVGDAPAVVIFMHMNDPRPDPCALAPELSPAYSAVIRMMMAKDPANRYQNPTELLQDLEAIEAHPDIPVSELICAEFEDPEREHASVPGTMRPETLPPKPGGNEPVRTSRPPGGSSNRKPILVMGVIAAAGLLAIAVGCML
ncbi:MAG: serine/threonine-protein kinase, partial [Verrucomicrobiota bacterium]